MTISTEIATTMEVPASWGRLVSAAAVEAANKTVAYFEAEDGTIRILLVSTTQAFASLLCTVSRTP